jgi:hypothetical protein
MSLTIDSSLCIVLVGVCNLIYTLIYTEASIMVDP